MGITVLMPALGGLLALLPRYRAKWVALGVSLATLGLAIGLIVRFLRLSGSDTIALDVAWLPVELGVDIRFHLGLDGISLWLFGLTALLFVTAILISWTAIVEKESLYYALLLLLETGCLGVFTARDILVFYVFFEFTLIPLFFLIGLWGSEQRREAAGKFFLYTLAGSVLTFLGLLTIVLWVGRSSSAHGLTFDIARLTEELLRRPMPHVMERWVFWALFAGFAIKVPLFPLHTWLPLAHVQAPAAGSVILAGILLKIGTYGFLRFSLPMVPRATAEMSPILIWLSVAGIIYGALVALAQSDMKRLIAYSSVSHLGFCMLGLFALNHLGIQGALLQMVNHGISTGALFAMVGMVYERYHTREISKLGGLALHHPWLTFFMVFFTLSSIGLPGLNGFAGELLILTGMFQRGWGERPHFGLPVASVIAVLGVILGAWYLLWLVQRVFFGPLRAESSSGHAPSDLSFREFAALAPLAVVVLWIGLHPAFFLRPVERPLANIVHHAESLVNPIATDAPTRQGLSMASSVNLPHGD